MKSKAANFAMSMFYHIKQLVVLDFFSKKVSFPWKTANWILLFAQSGRSNNDIENKLVILSPGSVSHCFKLLHHVQCRTTPLRNRGSNPVG